MNTTYKTIVLTGLVILLAACQKDFLEVTPKGRLVADEVADYDLLLNNLELININASAQVVMGDEIAGIQPYFDGGRLKNQRLFRWDALVYEPSENASELETPIKNIYVYNKIINELPEATNGTEKQKASLQAEARAGRAWTYFLLINLFGKPYDAATSATDLGFPILENADVTGNTFTRASVKEVYDFIIKDLTQAIPHLPATPSHRVRMSKIAAEGLLGKVYLFMRNPEEALKHLDNALAGLSTSTVPLGLYDYNKTFGPGGEFLPITSFGPNYPFVPNIKESVYAKQAYWPSSSNDLVLDKRTVNLFDPTDLRRNFYSSNAYYGPAYPSGFLKKTGPSNIQMGVIVPDLYLLRAECKARLNDLQGGKVDVEYLRKNRMPLAKASIPNAVSGAQKELIEFILEERIREFAISGFRWFDMRRLSVDPLFKDKTYSHSLYSEAGNIQSTYTLSTERLVLRFPQKVMDENPGMQNNP
ncbi:RagB/SusD family nutrient uptake outer membrane protein [Sphingobacterium yanglingense]|uniref:SusD-like starch-binding protein associating with outer membrane n=1 Tax=Sphingobacterium yanglingense TaxID=1437280 RepID=A0A4V3DCT9_9SPHI|nr:RagB/SusD family nutrient uptake outer membrane protein [Sphingobacterium yanglingense]TDQ73723.1 SusD-like starch-binding protein associating with outer membrane [Sphingobacterium yanglingense]